MSFLNTLKEEGKIRFVEPSKGVSDSYNKKAADCLKSSKLLLDNRLFENSITMSYYVMYNSLKA